jgi:hypothetical protein
LSIKIDLKININATQWASFFPSHTRGKKTFFFFFPRPVELGMEPRSPCMLGKFSTTKLHPQPRKNFSRKMWFKKDSKMINQTLKTGKSVCKYSTGPFTKKGQVLKPFCHFKSS